MTVGEIIQRVQSAYSKGVQSKDTRLSARHIYSAAITARETVLSQQASKGQTISDWNYQTISCIEVAPHSINPLVPKVKMLRSLYRIPRIISSIDTPLIKAITSLDGSIAYDRTSFSTYKYNNGNKFTSKRTKFLFKDNYLHLTIAQHLEAVTSMAVYSDPLEAATFPSLCPCVDCACQSAFDYDFFLDGRLEKVVVDLAIQELIVIFSQMKEDKSNNASDDNSGQVNYKQSQTDNNNNGV